MCHQDTIRKTTDRKNLPYQKSANNDMYTKKNKMAGHIMPSYHPVRPTDSENQISMESIL